MSVIREQSTPGNPIVLFLLSLQMDYVPESRNCAYYEAKAAKLEAAIESEKKEQNHDAE